MTIPLFEILDAVGAILLLVSVGWQIFFTETLESTTRSLEWLRLHEKLDQLHYRQGQLQKEMEYRLHGLETISPVQAEPLPSEWNPSAHEQRLDHVERQHRLLWLVKVGMFLLGSLLLLVARIIEYGYHQSAFIQT
ncbi:MAG TPA: hypothetical protein VEV20_01730 [Burkholderiales bacterium]|nr:hypothetical protein [Burkholderiales bacterium]